MQRSLIAALCLVLMGCSASTTSQSTTDTVVSARTPVRVSLDAPPTPAAGAPGSATDGPPTGTPDLTPSDTAPVDGPATPRPVTPALPATPEAHAPSSFAPVPGDLPTGLVTPDSSHKPVTARELGVAFYPGARQLGGGRMESSTLQGAKAVLVTVDLESHDGLEKVVSFYRGQLQGSRKTVLDDHDYHGVVLTNGALSVTISQTGKGPTTINLVNKNAPPQ